MVQGVLLENIENVAAEPADGDLTPGARHLAGRRMWEFPDGETNPARALRTARMDWLVERRPMYYRDNGGGEVASNTFAVVRTDDSAQLGSASERYQCIQNLEAARLFEPLLETGKFIIDSAGVTSSNRVWMAVRSSSEFDITGRGDQVVSRLIGHWKHGGDSSVRFQYLPMRIVCSNMIQRIVGGRTDGMSIRHYSNIDGAMQEVRGVFNLLQALEAEDIEAMMLMARKSVGDVKGYFSGLVEMPRREDYKTPASYDRAVHARDRVLREMHDRYEGGLGLDLCERGNFWAAYSAVTETIDHGLGVSGRRDYIDYSVFGAGSQLRSAAFETALACARAA